jgi:hypothetical protein
MLINSEYVPVVERVTYGDIEVLVEIAVTA